MNPSSSTHPWSSLLRRARRQWLLLALALTAGIAAQAAPVSTLVPAPAKAEARQGHFAIGNATVVRASDAEAAVEARRFIDWAARSTGHRLALETGGKPLAGEIVFALERTATASPESYALDIGEQGVRVRAADPRGLFYGAVSLWQLLPADAAGEALSLPALHIEDAPRFGWRGLMLDSARHYQDVDQIKRLLDAMALHKLNTFHWHLTDDQGWRIEIRKYPKLTAIGSCRVPAGDAGIGADGRPVPYCGHYTQEQIREVVRHAAALHITVVPEIDVPGHATAAIAAYPQLGVLDAPLAVSNEWGVNVNLFNADEATLRFLEDVLAEVLQLFPGRYVHVGGDEAVKDQWQASPKMQARMRQLGVANEAELQSYMLKRLEKFLAAHQRRLIGWDEILEGGLPPAATVMSWRGIEGGIDAARQGHDVVMSPSSDLYFDYLQTNAPDEPPGRPAMIGLRKVYDFEPVPAALDAGQRTHVLGVQANVWTEHMRSFARVQHAIFPRIAAMAETAWSPQAGKDYASFLARLPALLPHYRALGIGYAATPFQTQFAVQGDAKAGTATVRLSDPLGYDDIRYTTDGSAPTAASPRYAAPLQLQLPATVRAQVYADGQALAPATSRELSTASLHSRSDEELAMCTGALMLRLEDDGPREGARAIFNADIFNPCWEWKQADLRGIAALQVRAGRLPYYFQLAHDEPQRTFKPARTAHGELVIRDGCDGPALASVALPAAPGADGFLTLQAPLPADVDRADLCLYFTGDTRPAMWVLDRVSLLPRTHSTP